VVVTATRIDDSLPALVSLEVTDVAGNVTNCDHTLLEVGGAGEPHTATARGIVPSEHFVTAYNGTPGVSRLQIDVNRRTDEMKDLDTGEVRTVDIARALHKGQNAVTVRVEGKPRGGALIVISDTRPPVTPRRDD